MKTNFVFAVGLVFVFTVVWFMSLLGDNPEGVILGKWTEVSWSYEKMDHTNSTELGWLEEMDDHVKAELSKSLIIHEAEEWYFKPHHELSLSGKPGTKTDLTWKLSGRGNILELRHRNSTIEQYTIRDLSENKMVLHFNTDLQTRGIVKMIFSRKEEEYAEK